MWLFDKLFRRAESRNTDKQKVETVDPNDFWYTVATISNELPEILAEDDIEGYEINIHEDDWRQKEFLKPTSMASIEEETAFVKRIWKDSSKENGEYTIFKNCYVRYKIEKPDLSINLSNLKELISFKTFGVLKINGQTVLNSFSVETEHTTYYGILEGNIVTHLCIADWNEKTINEN